MTKMTEISFLQLMLYDLDRHMKVVEARIKKLKKDELEQKDSHEPEEGIS